MLRSFYSGISGLRNHQEAMDVLGNNIANVNTAGYKSSRVTFTDTLSQTIEGARAAGSVLGGQNPLQVGLGMTVESVDRNMMQGALQSTGNNLDLAIEGQGFFIVGEGENYYYTRSGAFSVDDHFNLVTANGDQVYGWVSDGTSATIDPEHDVPGFINLDRRGDGRITNAFASATSVVSGPNQGDGSLGSVTALPTTVTAKWRVECTDATTGQFTITRSGFGTIGTVLTGTEFSDPALGSFLISAGAPAAASVTVDSNGDGDTIQLTAVSPGAGGNSVVVEFVNEGANQTLGASLEGTKITVSLGTDSLGQVTSTEAQVAAAINANAQIAALVTAAVAGAGAGAGTAAVMSERYLQNGAGANLGDYFTFATTAPGGASLENLTISRDGSLVGIFDNGSTEEIARIGLGRIPNPQGLLAVGGGRYAESPASGSGFPAVGPGTKGTGDLASGFLEMSNVDLTREFTDMITTQRGFQANSRIITTSDEMLQDLLALKR